MGEHSLDGLQTSYSLDYDESDPIGESAASHVSRGQGGLVVYGMIT